MHLTESLYQCQKCPVHRVKVSKSSKSGTQTQEFHLLHNLCTKQQSVVAQSTTLCCVQPHTVIRCECQVHHSVIRCTQETSNHTLLSSAQNHTGNKVTKCPSTTLFSGPHRIHVSGPQSNHTLVSSAQVTKPTQVTNKVSGPPLCSQVHTGYTCLVHRVITLWCPVHE